MIDRSYTSVKKDRYTTSHLETPALPEHLTHANDVIVAEKRVIYRRAIFSLEIFIFRTAMYIASLRSIAYISP